MLQAKLSPGKRRTAMTRLGIRALKWPFKSKDIERMIDGLARCTQTISLALNVDEMTVILDIDQKTVLRGLPIAQGAAFDSHDEEHNPTCLQETRVELLREINEWIQNPNTEAIFWLNGMAGTGKSTISRTLAHVASSPRLKIFLTSRPELPIRLGFTAIKGAYQGLILHEVAGPVIEHDIWVFLEHELAQVRDDYNNSVLEGRHLPTTWPSEVNIQILVEMSVPLFIFAATVCRFIADRRLGDPGDQLQDIISYRETAQDSQLNATYLPVLNKLLVDLSGKKTNEVMERFREVVGSIISLANPLSAIKALQAIVQPDANKALSFLDNAHRFVLAIAPVIQQAPLQVYWSALIFAPKRSIVRTVFKKEIPSCIYLMPKVEEGWSQCLLALEGHSNWVSSVAFSPDSKLVASASDNTVRIWPAETGDCTRTLKGHSDWVSSVAFSPDSKLVASASYDSTVRIWSTNTEGSSSAPIVLLFLYKVR
ncbi:uncharacterized protein BCR38DRAFT_489623 [Pseudomassariella vexata]|uniref:Mitochondrial division protein 1 n=1 Tax=Pseudomassariella vexata TaxID=1141098 RepID=A0A1Y2DFS1_9PEZI|nr:uncharacterized protein BCR38DRAFT_489623 [Pseudomassariella vexata]ORY58143.1 hypothetical protein BCR38DRAFT_489623 [Pseudomassariella vexata]